jgi:protein-S-isoprenylcysteine O-methyltransferase Ste14
VSTEATFHIAFWVLFGILLVIRGISTIGVRRAGERLMPDHNAVEREGRGAFVLRVVMFFVLISMLVLYAINPPWASFLLISLPDWLRWAGFAVGLAGLALMAWAQAELGKLWSAQLQVRQEHHLVDSGPYARVRHPMYTSMLLFGIGLALVTAHWVFVLFAVVTIPGLIYRAPREEQMMIEQLGDEYRAYMKRAGRFLPKIG